MHKETKHTKTAIISWMIGNTGMYHYHVLTLVGPGGKGLFQGIVFCLTNNSSVDFRRPPCKILFNYDAFFGIFEMLAFSEAIGSF